jgi:hypothetical protein
MHKETLKTCIYFLRSVIIQNFRILHEEALLLFLRRLYAHCVGITDGKRLRSTKNGTASNDMMLQPTSTKICQLAQKLLLGADVDMMTTQNHLTYKISILIGLSNVRHGNGSNCVTTVSCYTQDNKYTNLELSSITFTEQRNRNNR